MLVQLLILSARVAERWLPAGGVFFLAQGYWWYTGMCVGVAFGARYYLEYQSRQPRPALQSALRTLFSTLNLERNLDRLTVYVPLKRRSGFAEQVVPYLPTGEWGSQRILSLAKGIVGRCLRTGDAEIELVPANADFLTRMVREWGFTRQEAQQLNPDRRSYLCVLLKNPETGAVIGAVYCDSSRDNAFTPGTIQEINRITAEWYNFL